MSCVCVCVFARVNEFYEENKNNDDSFFLSSFSSVRFTSARVLQERGREREIESVFAFFERTTFILFFFFLMTKHGEKGKKQKKTRRERRRKEKKNYTRHKQKHSYKRNMFSSLSMRSALVGTSVPTTSTNSRGMRIHRSRRAKLARIPAKMHPFFFFRALSFHEDELPSFLSGVDFI